MESAILGSSLLVPRSSIEPRHFNQFIYQLKDSYSGDDYTVETFREALHYYAFARGDLGKIHTVFGKDFIIEDERIAVPMAHRLKFTGKLHPEQEETLRKWIGAGYGMLQAPPRWGKTVWMTALACKLRQRTFMLAHLEDLCDQLEETIREFTNVNELEDECGQQLVGCVKDWSSEEPFPLITLSTYLRFAVDGGKGRRIIEQWKSKFGLVLVDEGHRCFLSGTRVDGKPIETLVVGDYVRSYNHLTNSTEKRKITHVFKYKLDKPVVKVSPVGTPALYCTTDHPFWVGDTYSPAECLGKSSMLHMDEDHHNATEENMHNLLNGLPTEDVEQDHDTDVFPGVQENSQGKKETHSQGALLSMQNRSRLYGENTLLEVTSSGGQGPSFLFGGVQDNSPKKVVRDNREAVSENESPLRIGKDDQKESHAQPCDQGESVNISPSNEMEAFYPGRERDRPNSSTASLSIGLGLGDGGNRTDEQRTNLPKSLQTRHCKQRLENSDRSGRALSQRTSTQSERREEGSGLRQIRVDSVALQEQGCPGVVGGLLGDGFLYNIEVEGNHNYFAEGILTHNCATDLFTEVVEKLPAVYRCGVTATPKRKDGLHCVVHDVLGPVTVVGVGEQLAIDWTWEPTGYQIKPFKSWAVLLNRLSKRPGRNAKIAKKVVEDVNDGHFVLVTTERVAHMEELKRRIQEIDCDITVGLLYGKTTHRKEFRKAAKRGEYQVVIAMNKIVELGYNIPRWSCFHNTLPMTNQHNWYQRVSRIRTPMQPAFDGDDYEKPKPVARVWVDSGSRAVWAYRSVVKKENDRLKFTCLNPAPARKKGKRKGLAMFAPE